MRQRRRFWCTVCQIRWAGNRISPRRASQTRQATEPLGPRRSAKLARVWPSGSGADQRSALVFQWWERSFPPTSPGGRHCADWRDSSYHTDAPAIALQIRDTRVIDAQSRSLTRLPRLTHGHRTASRRHFRPTALAWGLSWIIHGAAETGQSVPSITAPFRLGPAFHSTVPGIWYMVYQKCPVGTDPCRRPPAGFGRTRLEPPDRTGPHRRAPAAARRPPRIIASGGRSR